MSYEGKHGLPLSAVVRFVKWAYCYQQWEFFDFWLPRAMAAAEVCEFLPVIAVVVTEEESSSL